MDIKQSVIYKYRLSAGMYDYWTVGVNLSSYLSVWHHRLMPSELKPTPFLDTVCYSS
jgi:hypothetical protein